MLKGAEFMVRFADPLFELEKAFGRLDREWSGGMMPMDAFTRDDRFYLKFDLPGVDLGAIDMTVEKNVLSVTVERPREDIEGVTWAVRERPTGRHTRQVRVGDMVDFSQISADYADGVLTVTMPLREEIKPRRIEVNRADGVLEASTA